MQEIVGDAGLSITIGLRFYGADLNPYYEVPVLVTTNRNDVDSLMFEVPDV